MVLRFTQLLGVLIAALAISAPAAVAQDGDAGQVTRQAVEAMQRVTDATIDDIQAAAARGIAHIQTLDANGAPDREIIAAAHRALHSVARQAGQGNRRINIIAARAFWALHKLDADPRFFRIVSEAGGRSHDAIGTSKARASHAIRAALREALEG